MKESYLDAEQKKNKQLAKDVRSRDDLLSENIAKVSKLVIVKFTAF